MSIQTGDIKLLKSTVMADVPEGGGAPTGNAIPDGVSNSIFNDISELDRAGGDVSLRKIHVAVHTDDRDIYFGANVIVAEPPQDPNVSVTLFSTEDSFDRRTDAATRLESYLTAGPEWGGYLFENHVQGQRVVQLFQRPSAELPRVGQTLVLIQNEGLSNEVRQSVRATDVSDEIRLFYDAGTGRDFEALIVSVEISDALRSDFTGSPPSRTFQRASNGTKVRDTTVSDAGLYAGVTALAEAAALGDFTIKAESVFTQLVPSARTEVPIPLSLPYAQAGLPVPATAPFTYVYQNPWSPTQNLVLPNGCLPGSLSIQVAGLLITDLNGVLVSDGAQVGTIDYANGVCSSNSASFTVAMTITYRPATTLLRAPQSMEIPVTIESRAQSYTGVIVPNAARGTLAFAYRALGRWYVLSDSGNGQLRGLDSSYGAGNYSADTGAYVITLGALPDVDSSIVISWGVPTQETSHPDVTLKASQMISIVPPGGGTVQPGSMTLAWPGKTSTLGTNGQLSGDATGRWYAGASVLEFAPNELPAVGTTVTVEYTEGPKLEESFPYPSRDINGKIPVQAALGAINPGSLEVEWNTFTDEAVLGTYTQEQLESMGISIPVDPIQTAYDDGAGNIVRNGAIIGSVNYATGDVLFNPDVVLKIPRPVYISGGQVPNTAKFRIRYSGIEYVDAPSLYPNDTSGLVKLRYNAPGSTNSRIASFTFVPSFRLLDDINAQIVPGSVVLQQFQGGTFYSPIGDNKVGVLQVQTDTGPMAYGSIDYLTGYVTLTNWVQASNSIRRRSTVTTVGETISSEFVFRTAAAPLAPSSLSIVYANAVGSQVVTADANGVISAPGVTGSVHYESGIVRIRFGEFVAAAGNESQPWYNASLVENGQIFRPDPIAVSTLRYTAVAYSYLPLDADLLGLDPVMLPSDGRVPIFRPGGFVVLGHTGTITANVSNGQTINTARVRLSRVRVIGNNGVVINTGYTTDLEAGTVTFTDVSGYSQPVTIEHRIEDMAVVREVQISGELSVTRPLSHAYPLGSYISSALIAGDLFSRVSVVFDQATWNGTSWKDTVDGAAATGTYNDTLYPIAVTNRGAVTERWALRFTSTSSFEIIGEHVGVIGTGSINSVTAPINPATSVPYFTILEGGWGLGWSVGNILRFNTVGAQFPVWVVRTVQQGTETVVNDSFALLARGGVNRD